MDTLMTDFNKLTGIDVIFMRISVPNLVNASHTSVVSIKLVANPKRGCTSNATYSYQYDLICI